MSAPAYLIVENHVTDPEQFKRYMAEAPGAVKAYGGEYLARGGQLDVLEGDWNPHRMVLIRFPSFEQAKAFYDDAQYTRIRGLRKGAAEYFNMVLVEGVAAPV